MMVIMTMMMRRYSTLFMTDHPVDAMTGLFGPGGGGLKRAHPVQAFDELISPACDGGYLAGRAFAASTYPLG